MNTDNLFAPFYFEYKNWHSITKELFVIDKQWDFFCHLRKHAIVKKYYDGMICHMVFHILEKEEYPF